MASRKELAMYGSVPLPATIPCSQCKIPKKPGQYSAKRLVDLQKWIIMSRKNKKAFDPKTERFICCSLCLGGPAVEHECFHCAITCPITYFSKNMLKKNRDEALCWTCSERQQNETLSSDEYESGSGSDASDSTFITNRFEDLDVGSIISDSTYASHGNGLSSADYSSGGVPLGNHTAPSTVAGTIYPGASASASIASSTLGAVTSPSAARTANIQASSRAGSSLSGAPSRAPTSNGRSNGFNPGAYGNPGRRSPTGSMASAASMASNRTFTKVRAVPTKIDSDAAREQQKDMKRRVAVKEDDLGVAESDSE